MEEIIETTHSIPLTFEKLQRFDLEHELRQILQYSEYNTQEFEVIEMLNYKVLEMPVFEDQIVCKVRMKIRCNYPRAGKVVVLKGFEPMEKNMVYSSKRIQVIAPKPVRFSREGSFELKIEKVSTFSKNILCVAEVLKVL